MGLIWLVLLIRPRERRNYHEAHSFDSTNTVKQTCLWSRRTSGRGDSVWGFVSQQDTRLSLIATDHNYRQNFTAADNSRSTKIGTIRSIIDMIVRVLDAHSVAAGEALTPDEMN